MRIQQQANFMTEEEETSCGIKVSYSAMMHRV